MIQPTAFEIENAATRARIAAEGDAERERAVEACGPGAKAYARWVVNDKFGGEPPRIIYCCSRPELVGWQPRPEFEGIDARWTDHPGYDFNGKTLYPFRYEIRFSALSEYRPQSAEQLAAARHKREEKAAAEEAAEAERLARLPKQLTLF